MPTTKKLDGIAAEIRTFALGLPVMIAISMLTRERARRLSLFGAVFFLVLLAFGLWWRRRAA